MTGHDRKDTRGHRDRTASPDPSDQDRAGPARRPATGSPQRPVHRVRDPELSVQSRPTPKATAHTPSPATAAAGTAPPRTSAHKTSPPSRPRSPTTTGYASSSTNGS